MHHPHPADYEPTLPAWDDFIDEVEALIRAEKRAVSVRRRRRRRRRPANRLDLSVKSVSGRQDLKLTASRFGDDIYIELLDRRNTVLRQWHNDAPHGNPDDRVTDERHKHYPSEIYRVNRHHGNEETWAYSTTDVDDTTLLSALQGFCKECNISLEGVQLQLEWERE